VAGPHPYPTLVRELQRVIGDEARAQCLERFGALPDAVVACVGGGSNALGAFTAFLADAEVRLVAVEAGGEGLASGKHGASLSAGRFGVLHGSASSVLQTEDGQVAEAHSVSAGLDYPGVGPELAYLRDSGRLQVRTATDDEALEAFQELCALEGILPALESAHALARTQEVAQQLGPGKRLLVNLSGRGDKDLVHALAEIARRRPEANT
jgi:tryptophan synthase beta chain